MKKYKLIALNCTAKLNRVLRKEDNKTYSEDAWDEGVADKLVKDGFLEVVGKTQKEAPKVDEPKKETISKAEESAKEAEAKKTAEAEIAAEAKGNEEEENQDDAPSYTDVTASTLKANLTAKGIEFKSNDSKKKLYKKLYGIDA